MKLNVLILILLFSAVHANSTICTVAFTGMTCPLLWRVYEPPMFCVTQDGVPQKGCHLSGFFAYDMDVEEMDIENCFRVRWFWNKI